MLIRFHLIPERYGRTDRRTDKRTETDRFAISISRVSGLFAIAELLVYVFPFSLASCYGVVNNAG